MEQAIDLTKWEGQRNKTIIEVLFSCGLRVSELVNLKLSDIFEEEKFIRVLGKGSKERLVPISETAIKQLHYWYMDRNQMKIKQGEEDYVFLNRRGAHLTRTMILIMIKNAAKDAGIKKPSRLIPFGIVLQQPCSRVVPICVLSRPCWVMKIWERQKSIHIWKLPT